MHIFLDLSRLLWRAERFAPTGIDRVELAYAKHLIAARREGVSFTGYWGRLGLLPDGYSGTFIEAVDAVWSGTSIDGAARARTAVLARGLRARLLLGARRRFIAAPEPAAATWSTCWFRIMVSSDP